MSQINNLIDFFRKQKAAKFPEAFKSIAGKKLDFVIQTKRFWKFITDIYERHLELEGFTSFYWTIIGFLIHILGSLQSIPLKADIYRSTTGYASLSALMRKYIHNGKLIDSSLIQSWLS